MIDWEAEDRRWRRHVIESRILLTLITVLWGAVIVLIIAK